MAAVATEAVSRAEVAADTTEAAKKVDDQKEREDIKISARIVNLDGNITINAPSAQLSPDMVA
jgi:hypothetical protein